MAVLLLLPYLPLDMSSSCVLSKWTINAILENPNVMMRENHNTQSCEYIIICQNGLYIASITHEEILHMLKDVQAEVVTMSRF